VKAGSKVALFLLRAKLEEERLAAGVVACFDRFLAFGWQLGETLVSCLLAAVAPLLCKRLWASGMMKSAGKFVQD